MKWYFSIDRIKCIFCMESSTVSVLLSSTISFIAWIATSLSASCRIVNILGFTTSFLPIVITTFPEIFRRNSPTSAGLELGLLSYRINLNSKNASSDGSLASAFISTFLNQTFFMTLGKAFRK